MIKYLIEGLKGEDRRCNTRIKLGHHLRKDCKLSGIEIIILELD